MKPLIYLFGLAMLLCGVPCGGGEEGSRKPTYVIPIKGMIERGLVYVVRRGAREALQDNAAAVVFEMDTPGGRLDAAEEIINTIVGLSIPTYTYVSPQAISAGAIIAMATDKIYMAPGGRIGDAMPIMVSPFGAPVELNEALEEKSVSYVAALIRSTAERKGHDPQLAEAMVRRQMEYKIGDKIISPAGQILTLTSGEAEQLVERGQTKEPLLSSGTVASLDELIRRINPGSSQIKRLTVTAAEEVARYIEMFSVLFLVGGLLALYVEFKTPGFGLPGIMGILLLGIWFWGHHVAGLAGMGELVILVLGVILLLVELFLIPGFGVVGFTGIGLILLALIMAMVEHYPGERWKPPLSQVHQAIRTFGLSLLLAAGGGLALARFLPKSSFFQKLTLGSSVGRNQGFVAAAVGDELVGLHGIAVTALRPAGVGMFGERRLDVVTRGQFVEAGAKIVVVEVRGNRILVEREEGKVVA
ncbi:MAG: NfeD family protein [Kiritimatiellia bacterium]